MPRQYTQRTSDEKFQIVQEFFSSGLSLTNYARNNNIPRTTLFQWVEKYNSSITTETNNNANFINVTNESFEIANPKTISKLSNVKLRLNNGNTTLEFDVSILERVLEVIK